MKNVFPQKFTELIATTLGLRVREQEQAILWPKLLKRARALGLPSLESYYQRLVLSSQTDTQEPEWRELINLLTVNESYFFRDQGQFSLLRNRVLPELISRKQNADTNKNSLRIWSAGCSTGEEAYSIAILLSEMLPADQKWDILVLGTDVNASALDHAKQGIYNDWSFRSVNLSIRDTYFQRSRQGWEIDPSIRNMVTFQAGNLMQDNYPNAESEIHDLDLIICRNVFIYFSREAVASVLDRFYRSLSPGGYLMTGHTELYGQTLAPFQVAAFPESVVYQRPLEALPANPTEEQPPHPAVTSSAWNTMPKLVGNSLISATPLLPSPHSSRGAASPALSAATQPKPSIAQHHLASWVNELRRLMERKAYTEAIHQARQIIQHEPHHVQAHYFMAEAYANLGDHLNAIQICQRVLKTAPFAIEPFYLMAQIAQEQGDIEEAKSLLKRVIYLAPTSVYAYFELGCLYEQQGNLLKARRSWQSALEILRPMAHDTPLGIHRSLTVAELKAATEQKLNRPTPT